jgi:hypothetical protein
VASGGGLSYMDAVLVAGTGRRDRDEVRCAAGDSARPAAPR